MNDEQYVEKYFDEERKPRKTMGSIQDLRTPMKARLRSKPKVEGQEYLDMYVMTRDRARWERMKQQSRDTLKDIVKEMRKTYKDLPLIDYLTGQAGQEKPNEQPVARANGPRPIRPMKKVPLDY